MDESNANNSRASARHDPLACAFWMILSCALLAGLSVIARYVTTSGVPPFQVVFLRVIFVLVTMLPLFALRGKSFIRTTQWRQSDEHVEKTLASSDFKPTTQWTVTDPKIVRANIAAARRDGYMVTDQQSLPHEISTAAPVLNSEGNAIAAVQIPVYMPDWDIGMVKEKIVPLVIETARAISGSFFSES